MTNDVWQLILSGHQTDSGELKDCDSFYRKTMMFFKEEYKFLCNLKQVLAKSFLPLNQYLHITIIFF